LGIGYQHDVAPATTVAPVRTASGDVFLPTEGDAAVSTFAGRHMDLCLIKKHGRLRMQTGPAAD